MCFNLSWTLACIERRFLERMDHLDEVVVTVALTPCFPCRIAAAVKSRWTLRWGRPKIMKALLVQAEGRRRSLYVFLRRPGDGAQGQPAGPKQSACPSPRSDAAAAPGGARRRAAAPVQPQASQRQTTAEVGQSLERLAGGPQRLGATCSTLATTRGPSCLLRRHNASQALLQLFQAFEC